MKTTHYLMIGALGTTVLLFVNVFAVGLLTLAAPILAVVLKSKVAGDIRQQAKEKVPGAIFHAAAAMKPHFDQCVDDFSTRLREFVTTLAIPQEAKDLLLAMTPSNYVGIAEKLAKAV